MSNVRSFIRCNVSYSSNDSDKDYVSNEKESEDSSGGVTLPTTLIHSLFLLFFIPFNRILFMLKQHCI